MTWPRFLDQWALGTLVGIAVLRHRGQVMKNEPNKKKEILYEMLGNPWECRIWDWFWGGGIYNDFC